MRASGILFTAFSPPLSNTSERPVYWCTPPHHPWLYNDGHRHQHSFVLIIVTCIQWIIVVLVPVIMELDGLSSHPAQLGEAARAAMIWVSSLMRSHSSSLKVQTSRWSILGAQHGWPNFADYHMAGWALIRPLYNVKGQWDQQRYDWCCEITSPF